ncbi:DUF6941 family protein [Tepidiforma sp.]|uniref:DUF6941 family protein n=1 Tax=Tepidiforma sp. TaxID=2682230 RepID=UPI002ADE2165|nr:hypothetical protein [Tepidiforma sp.]
MPDEPQQSSPRLHGPYLQLAAICENVIEDRSGVLSLIRVIDRITFTALGPGEFDLQAVEIPLYAVVAFVSGDARGRHDLSLSLRGPDDLVRTRLTVPVLLEGDDRGARAIVRFPFRPDQEGVYWIDVALDERPFTRMPLRVFLGQVVAG